MFLDRFWGKVRVVGECWEWTGLVTKDGYGYVRLGHNGGPRRAMTAHRLAWELLHGEEMPSDMDAAHTRAACRRTCVRHVEAQPRPLNRRWK